jgi:hypothetical protein
MSIIVKIFLTSALLERIHGEESLEAPFVSDSVPVLTHAIP